MSTVQVDPARLDDPEVLAAADPGDMLRQVASAAAQVREAQLYATEAGVDRVADDGRPRAIVVAATGTAGLAGDLLAAVCGPGCPVPVTTVRGHLLPGWVGAADLVIAVSWSGRTEETVAAAAEAARRGCRLLCVGGGGSPLAEIAAHARAPLVPVSRTGPARSGLWSLAVPVLLAGRALGLADVSAAVAERVAGRLEETSRQCRPASESFVNPGKQIALEIAGSIPVIWSTSPLTRPVAYRFGAQLAENAKYPALCGELPEVRHHQVAAFDGPFGGAGHDDDLFRDRVEEPAGTRLRLVIVRDTEEDPWTAGWREAATGLARDRGVPVTELTADDGHPLERLAGLIAYADYASVYLALAVGQDPTPAPAVQRLDRESSTDRTD